MITIKEEFITGPKVVRAIGLGGHETVTLWLCLKRYAAMHPTDGFVPNEAVQALVAGLIKRPKRAMRALVECGTLDKSGERGAGLVEPTEHGWQLHDYAEHANDRTDEELRKERARLRKRQQREAKKVELARLRDELSRDMSQDTSGTVPGTCPGDVPSPVPVGQIGDPRAGARPGPGRGAIPTQPNPTQPNPDPDLTADPRPVSPTEPVGCDDRSSGEPAGKIKCPVDLRLLPEQVASLELSLLIPGWAVDQLTAKFVAKSTGDPRDRRTLEHWRKCLSTAICGDWSDPQRRPKQPPAADDPTRVARAEKLAAKRAAEHAEKRRLQSIRDAEECRARGIDPTDPAPRAPGGLARLAGQ